MRSETLLGNCLLRKEQSLRRGTWNSVPNSVRGGGSECWRTLKLGSAVGVGDSRFRGRRVVRKALEMWVRWISG